MTVTSEHDWHIMSNRWARGTDWAGDGVAT
jgi:hypothetical protein